MPFFAERMKALVDDIRSSRKDRAEALAELQKHTDQFLSETRSFVGRMHQEERDMASNLRAMLAGHHRQCRENVQAMQQEHFRQRAETTRAVRDLLGNARRARHDRLSHLRQHFHEARQAVADDLRQAARFWRECVSNR